MSVTFITGCSSGFGLLSALHFARRGDRVFATMRDPAKAGELLRARAAESLPIDILQLDVTDDASVATAVSTAIDAAGRIDVVVNNAGIGHQGPIEETADDEVREIFETNVLGVLRVLRAALPHMREQGGGTIVNVSSLAGRVAAPGGGIYAASKYALEAISESLYYEVQPFGIRAIIIEPGGFPTAFQDSIRRARRLAEGSPYYERYLRYHERMSQRPGSDAPHDPQTVAEAIYDAVHDAEPRLRYLVGRDAEMIGGLRERLSDIEFERTMRQALGVPS